MKKYMPSVKNNNAVKEELQGEIKALLYRIEKGKFDKRLSKEGIEEIYMALKSSYSDFEDIIFTGEENLESISGQILTSVSTFKKTLDQDLLGHVAESADDLQYYLDTFVAVAKGEIVVEDEEDLKEKKLSWSQKRLYARLDELGEIKATFTEQEKRLENDISGLERDLAELEEKMVAEDNERLINELYRKITTLKSKLDMMNVRRSNYSACFGVLDLIYSNANEILTAGEFSGEEISKAKVLLNMGKLRAVASEPDKAIGILKAMEKDINEISAKVKAMDEKVFGLNTAQTAVSDSALAYKAELMRKKREKEQNEENLSDLEMTAKLKVQSTEEK